MVGPHERVSYGVYGPVTDHNCHHIVVSVAPNKLGSKAWTWQSLCHSNEL